MVKLHGLSWHFDADQSARSVLTLNDPHGEFATPADGAGSFTVKLTVSFNAFSGEKHILDMPGVLGIRLRRHDPHDRDRQNYPACKMPDGSVPVLEATALLIPPSIRIGGR